MRPVLFCDRGCPFAHRVLALLHLLGIEHERREAPLGEPPEGLHRHAPTGRIPLWVDGDLVLSESRVILEYLSEAHGWSRGWPGGWPSDARARARHRLAAEAVDQWMTPWLFGVPPDATVARLPAALDALEAAIAAPPAAGLLALVVGPVWLRCGWYARAPVLDAVARRPGLQAWLDAARDLPSVRATAPHREAHYDDLRQAVREGHLPSQALAALPVG